jgi:hypothetical protein
LSKKRWLAKYIPEKNPDGGGANSFNNFNAIEPPDIEEENTRYRFRESETMTTDAKYTIKLIRGRKVYEDEERQLPVWSKKDCEERIAKLFASDENHADWLMKMAHWSADFKNDEMAYAWSGDCLAVIHEAYERAEEQSLEPKAEVSPEASEPVAKPAEDKPKAKLFGIPKPKLFARKNDA